MRLPLARHAADEAGNACCSDAKCRRASSSLSTAREVHAHHRKAPVERARWFEVAPIARERAEPELGREVRGEPEWKRHISQIFAIRIFLVHYIA